MSVLLLVLYVAIGLFILVMWVRIAFDLISSFNRGWRPRGAALVVAEIAYAITDPPVKLVRRIVPPLRFGDISLDLAWTVVMLLALIVSVVIARFL